jgi:23S rRNA (uracil1939-C5)-methyltransferase
MKKTPGKKARPRAAAGGQRRPRTAAGTGKGAARGKSAAKPRRDASGTSKPKRPTEAGAARKPKRPTEAGAARKPKRPTEAGAARKPKRPAARASELGRQPGGTSKPRSAAEPRTQSGAASKPGGAGKLWSAPTPRGARSRKGAAQVGDVLEVFIESLAAGGDGVGRDDSGRVAFVPYAAPGDTVKAQIFETHRDYARAEPVEIVVSSAFRVDAPCPHFVARTCGGCQWQHLGEAVQAAAKDELCARLLRKHVGAGLELYPLRAEVSPYHWRRRARLHWYRPRKADAAILGFYGPRSHHVSDISACVQLEPALKQAVDALRDRLASVLGRQGMIEALAGHLGEVHVFIHGRADREVAAALVGQGPIVGVMLDEDGDDPPRPARGGVVVDMNRAARRPRKRAVHAFGKPHIELEPDFPGRADWFAQPSLAGNQALLEVVDEATAPRAGLRVLELHAGAGNLSRVLAPGTAAFVAVDHRKPPWPLPEALDRAFIAGDVAEVTRRLADEGQRFDLVVLDPPRTGAREVVDSVVALAPGRIVYVSCDLATLARDLDLLAASGYRARWAQPLDLMPQTAHVEIVVVLEPAAPAAAPAS